MEDTQMKSKVDPSVMSANGLYYKMPQPLSSSVNRTFKREYSQRQSYSNGDTIIFDWNTGSSYVDPCSCLLSFDLTATAQTAPSGGDAVSFGTNSAVALIQEIRILSKNGAEIERLQNVGVLSKILTDYQYSVEGQKMLTGAGYGTSYAGGVKTKVVIPMSLISRFFSPIVKNQKIPAGLASGLRIEITTAAPARSLTRTAGTGTDFTYLIEDPEMLLMLHTLNDSTQAVLMEESATNGLEYTFLSSFHTPVSGSSLRINEQIKKAVSQCCRVYSAVYDSVDVNDELKDGYSSVDADRLVNFQYRVGSDYYPHKSVNDKIEAWMIAETAFNKVRDIRMFPSNVNFTDYNTTGKFIVAHPLESDGALNLSGVPLNNSNTLELRLELNDGGSPGIVRTTDIFIDFVTVVRTFINKSSIKI
jgi:hypothetical protein